jgi:hypothetical protein
MKDTPAWEMLNGRTAAEKLETLGVVPGQMHDISTLCRIGKTYGISVYLFFEEDLARTRTIESVQEEYGKFPEYERPYILVEGFLRFTKENDPSFEQTMREFPLMIEIVNILDIHTPLGGNPGPCITGLMPFLDELDVEAEPKLYTY